MNDYSFDLIQDFRVVFRVASIVFPTVQLVLIPRGMLASLFGSKVNANPEVNQTMDQTGLNLLDAALQCSGGLVQSMTI